MNIFSMIASLWATALASSLLPAVLIFLVGLIVVNALMKALDKALSRSKLEKAAHSLVRSVARVALYALLIAIVAAKLGIDLTSVIAIASVATLAVSLALQTALSNVVGGLTLLSNHPFRAGDYVEVCGQAGTVQEVGITYTKLLTPDNKVISLPNSAVTSAQIVNYSVSGKRRVELSVAVSYDNNVETVLEALKEVADLPCTRKDDGVFTGVEAYGESTVSYVVRFWVDADKYWDGFFEGQRRIPQVLKEHGIILSSPHLTVHLDK